MSINNSTKSDNNQEFASTFQRAFAILIDVWIVIFIRFFFLAFLGELWMNDEVMQFKKEYEMAFGTNQTNQPPGKEQIDFVKNHSIFIKSIIFYSLVLIAGAIYYAYLHSSKWQATIGKRIMKIHLIKKNDMPISFKRALLYYILSILPFIYIIYIMTFVANYKISLLSAVTANISNILLTILFVAWVQTSVFMRNKDTIYDMICNTTVKKGLISQKFPW